MRSLSNAGLRFRRKKSLYPVRVDGLRAILSFAGKYDILDKGIHTFASSMVASAMYPNHCDIAPEVPDFLTLAAESNSLEGASLI